jgi:hypothetical protein
MTGITTVQTDPKIAYYFLVGNENANAVLNGYAGFNRQFVTMVYSGGLQYSYQNDRFSWFNNLAYTTKLQDVLGSQHESPGAFESQNVMALSSVNLKFGNKLLNATLNGFYNAGSADEFMQEKIETRNPTTGIVSYAWTTLYAYDNRYQTESYRANIDVSLRNQLNSGKDYSWLGGVDAQFDGYQNRYYLPYSQIGNQRLRVGASGSLRVFNKNDHKVTLALKGGYGFNVKKQLVLNVNATTAPVNGSSNFQRGTYRIANEVILPDMDFYSQKVIDYRVDARYTFPIKIKMSKITGMAKIYYGNQQSNTRGSWMNMGVSIGIVSL